MVVAVVVVVVGSGEELELDVLAADDEEDDVEDETLIAATWLMSAEVGVSALPPAFKKHCPDPTPLGPPTYTKSVQDWPPSKVAELSQ